MPNIKLIGPRITKTLGRGLTIPLRPPSHWVNMFGLRLKGLIYSACPSRWRIMKVNNKSINWHVWIINCCRPYYLINKRKGARVFNTCFLCYSAFTWNFFSKYMSWTENSSIIYMKTNSARLCLSGLPAGRYMVIVILVDQPYWEKTSFAKILNKNLREKCKY